MKKLIFYLGIAGLAIMLAFQPVSAQTHSLTKKEKRKLEQMRKKKERTLQRQDSHRYYAQLLKNKYFVFEADYLSGPEGQSFVLSPEINFMSVNGNKVTLQFGFNGIAGWNGVGGITVNGTLQNYRFTEGKKKNNMLVVTDMIVEGPALPPHITLNVSDDGTAQLMLQPAAGPPVILYGQIFSPEKASIFMGQSLY